MSLEFAIEHPCPLRARYDEEHLRAWGRLGNLHTRLTTGERGAPSEEKLRFVERAGVEIERMEEATTVCLKCPAHLPREAAGEGEPVGCLGRITYPIEAQFEKFLADRVQLALDTLEEADQPRLLRILLDPDSPFDGEGTKSLRQITTADGLRFLELRLPIKLARAASHLTTDHLFDALAGFTSDDSARTTYTRELPLAATADYYDFLDLILRNDLSTSERQRISTRSRNYQQFLRLLSALELAEALRARVLLD
ncbi:MAG TPA: hypothetical protein VGV59_03785 [Pyrinomonadaceae bacterium]|nr:hypothetical protein [Pyrinomonadaceae bacterium]